MAPVAAYKLLGWLPSCPLLLCKKPEPQAVPLLPLSLSLTHRPVINMHHSVSAATFVQQDLLQGHFAPLAQPLSMQSMYQTWSPPVSNHVIQNITYVSWVKYYHGLQETAADASDTSQPSPQEKILNMQFAVRPISCYTRSVSTQVSISTCHSLSDVPVVSEQCLLIESWHVIMTRYDIHTCEYLQAPPVHRGINGPQLNCHLVANPLQVGFSCSCRSCCCGRVLRLVLGWLCPSRGSSIREPFMFRAHHGSEWSKHIIDRDLDRWFRRQMR